MFTLQRIDNHIIRPFILMVEPGLRRALLKAIGDKAQIILGASCWGQAAGVAVVHIGKEVGQLTDLYVLPSYRQAGLGAALLLAAEEQAKERGCPTIQAIYRPNQQTPIFEKLLAAHNWTPPIIHQKLFWTRCAVSFGPWVNRYRFRPPYELFSWSDLTQAERQQLEERGKAGWYPPLLNPFHRSDDTWDPQTSVGLRYKGEVVGWCLTVREKPDVMLVDILFVDPPLQRLGRGFMMVGEVIRRYCASGGDYAYWRVQPDNEPMLRWSRKAFAGSGLIEQYDEWYSEKILRP